MKILKFTDDQSNHLTALWEKFGPIRIWNNSEKDTARKNCDQSGKFLIGQIDGVLMASIMLGCKEHRSSIIHLAVDPDHSGAGYWQDFVGRG